MEDAVTARPTTGSSTRRELGVIAQHAKVIVVGQLATIAYGVTDAIVAGRYSDEALATLAYQGRIQPGLHRIETPVGIVTARLHESGEVSVQNVPSYRHAKGALVNVEGHGSVTGDIAWGGNWFFLVSDHGQDLRLSNAERLTEFAWRIREALEREGVTGKDGGQIDHVELFSPSQKPGAQSKNFVLCPGKAYDRSPCGTGTSAKLACLFADGKLQVGQTWKQQSVVGSIFEGSVQLDGDKIIPTITGEAWVMSEGTILVDERDPFANGI